ncbi:MAG TPA: hypothetical protein VEL31_03815 [Ktedonobacteraceae bacterium]|nr:hypothetical protein [Ktedonobacteraceae bacterium]
MAIERRKWDEDCYDPDTLWRSLTLTSTKLCKKLWGIPRGLCSAQYRVFSASEQFLQSNGFEGLSRLHGVKVDDVRLSSGALAQYVAKLQEGASIRMHAAQELTRANLKRGHQGTLMPFDILLEFFNTGDMEALGLWHEYERETRGKLVIRFTKGLRALLLPDEVEKTDEELAAEEIGGVDVVRFAGWFYRKIARVPGLEGKVLTALDTGGFAALVELLTCIILMSKAGTGGLKVRSKTVWNRVRMTG